MFTLRLCRCTLAVGLLPVWAAVSSAQTTAGLNGSITDATGALIANAKVTVVNAETGIQRDAASDAAGLYDVRLLQPGTYNIAVQKEGFRQITRENVRLEVNQVARIDFVMQLGAVTEAVEVEAAAPLLESSNSSVGQVIETKAVSHLPLNGRNFAQLAILSPGAIGVGYGPAGTIGSGSRPDDTRPGAELMVNGNREMSNNFMLDGVDDNFRRNALITVRPSVEDILEFKIQTICSGPNRGATPGLPSMSLRRAEPTSTTAAPSNLSVITISTRAISSTRRARRCSRHFIRISSARAWEVPPFTTSSSFCRL